MADNTASVVTNAAGSDSVKKATVEEMRRALIQKRRAEDPLYYQDYLRVKTLLTLQQPASREAGCEAHDEHLFIVIHQVYELWFKQILHEIDSVRRIFSAVPVDEKLIAVAVARLQRVKEIQQILVQQLTVLETMSSIDFLDFRDFLYPASGFQSVQFRLVENKLGLPPQQRLSYAMKGYCSYLKGIDAEEVSTAEQEPSLYALIEAWLERTPFMEHVGGWTWWAHYREAVLAMIADDEEGLLSNATLTDAERDMAKKELAATRAHFESLLNEETYEAGRQRGERRLSYRALQAALLITLYHDEPILQLPFRLLSTLLDIDENLTAWRYRHALMVHRMIGVKLGTGGSAGYHYLRASAERHKIFTDLFNLSTFLIPRHLLPPLPDDVRARLAFAFVPTTGSTALAATAPTTISSSSSLTASRTGHGHAVAPHGASSGAGAAQCPMGFGRAGGSNPSAAVSPEVATSRARSAAVAVGAVAVIAAALFSRR